MAVVCPPLVGDGAAGDTDGVVPGEVATGSFGLHALNATTTTGMAKKAAAATVFSIGASVVR